MSEYLTFAFDWTLSHAEFRDSIRGMIHDAQKDGKVLPLPIKIATGQLAIDLSTLILARIDCESCDAQCCRGNPKGKMTALLATEYRRLSEKYGQGKLVIKDEKYYLPMPCSFLRKRPQDSRGTLCSIYQDRPIACVLYPIQFDAAVDFQHGPMISLESSCRSARRLARDIYMSAWQLRYEFRLLGDEEFLKGLIK